MELQQLLGVGKLDPTKKPTNSKNPNKKNPRKSILDDIETVEDFGVNDDDDSVVPKIVATQRLVDYQLEKTTEKVIEQNKQNVAKQKAIEKIKLQHQQQKVENVTPSIEIVPEEVNEEARVEVESVLETQLPEDVNCVEIENAIGDALELEPDLDPSELKVIKLKEVDKSGYHKTKVVMGRVGELLNTISSEVKKESKHLISPREVDVRVTANTNKTQLKSSSRKLSATSVVYKPDFTKVKVNKGTRIMLSLPEKDSDKGLCVYIQESRLKSLTFVGEHQFSNQKEFIKFLVDLIVSYYSVGYDATYAKLNNIFRPNLLTSVISAVTKSNEFKSKTHSDKDGHIYAVDFKAKDDRNQWLYVQVIEADLAGTYSVLAKSTVDTFEIPLAKKNCTINELVQKLYFVIQNAYNKDWSKELDIDENMYHYLYNKLTHKRLKIALDYLNNFSEGTIKNAQEDIVSGNITPINLQLLKTISKIDAVKLNGNAEYDAEGIVAKTDFCDFFILSYLAIQIKGGDKRKGSEYITTDKYNQTYGIKNPVGYSDRKRTITKKQNLQQQRNYNARKYMFQLEYVVNGEKHQYRDFKLQDVLESTGILTKNIKFPKSPY